MLSFNMKQNKTSIRIYFSDALLFGAFAVTKVCLEKIGKHMDNKSKQEEATKRNLTMMILIYQAIGIFYNE